MNTSTIYGLYDPREPIELENCRYIGQTVNPLDEHLKDHLSSARRQNKAGRDKWIRELESDGILPEIHSIEVVDEELCQEIEWNWIELGFAKGWPLTNEGTGRVPLKWDVYGKYLTPAKIKAFWAKVRIASDNECWEWTAYTNDDGYGMFSVGSRIDNSRRRLYAHRLAWELTYGPIPNRLFVCHTCDNPPCVNPNHLFLDTLGGNMKDCASKGRTRNQYTDVTHCKNGHEFTEENTHISPRGGRVCIICRNLASCIRQREVRERALIANPRPNEALPEDPPKVYTMSESQRSAISAANTGNPGIIAAAIKGGNAFKEKLDTDPEFAAAWRKAQAEANKIGKQKMYKKRVQCDECGFISNPQGIGHHQTSFGHSGKTILEPIEEFPEQATN